MAIRKGETDGAFGDGGRVDRGTGGGGVEWRGWGVSWPWYVGVAVRALGDLRMRGTPFVPGPGKLIKMMAWHRTRLCPVSGSRAD